MKEQRLIDLHIHSQYSTDGILEISELLSKAEANNLSHFSITDHDNVDAYKNDIPKFRKIFSGKIIPGVEINSHVNGIPVEILSYNHNIDDMSNYLSSYFSPEKKLEDHIKKVNFLFHKADQLKLEYDKNILKIDKINNYSTGIFLDEIKKYPNNKNKFPREVWDNEKIFYRQYFTNPDNKFWCFNVLGTRPDSNELIKKIHELNGLAFLAHPFEYKQPKTIDLLNEVAKQKIDGIECYHLSAQGEKNKFLTNYVSEHDLLMSGGSDFHGTFVERLNIIGDKDMPFEVRQEVIDKWAKNL
jgi:predicted metal-dependent phosphoesterase TrpH